MKNNIVALAVLFFAVMTALVVMDNHRTINRIHDLAEKVDSLALFTVHHFAMNDRHDDIADSVFTEFIISATKGIHQQAAIDQTQSHQILKLWQEAHRRISYK